MKTIFYVAGKSGGHIIPALTLAQQQQEQAVCGIFSTDAALDAQLINNCSAITYHIPLPLSAVSWKQPLFFVCFIRSLYRSLRTLHAKKPACVVSTGGLVSIPVCMAAWLLRIPFDLYEFNVEPGAAIKALAPYARTVYICFPTTKRFLRGATQTMAYPVRYSHDAYVSAEEARAALQIAPHKKVLMIIGGSQGSRFLNSMLAHWVTRLAPAECAQLHIIHQAGGHDVAQLQELYRTAQIDATVFAYRDDIERSYQAADYIITRAGSGVLHELLFFNKRALIIPLEVASTAHQVSNAQAFVERDAASWSMLQQQDFVHDDTLLYRTLKKQLFTNLTA